MLPKPRKAKSPETPDLPPPTYIHRQAHDMVEFWADWARIESTLHQIRVYFATSTTNTDRTEITVTEKCHLTTSPMMVKSLAAMLLRTIDAYEHQYGATPTDADDLVILGKSIRVCEKPSHTQP
jgi:hypothetical protein